MPICIHMATGGLGKRQEEPWKQRCRKKRKRNLIVEHLFTNILLLLPLHCFILSFSCPQPAESWYLREHHSRMPLCRTSDRTSSCSHSTGWLAMTTHHTHSSTTISYQLPIYCWQDSTYIHYIFGSIQHSSHESTVSSTGSASNHAHSKVGT